MVQNWTYWTEYIEYIGGVGALERRIEYEELCVYYFNAVSF